MIFITGTDTGVGKTLLTRLLLIHLRGLGTKALAVKPLCSGGRADVHLLHAAQDGILACDEINPFYARPLVAPLVAQRMRGRPVHLSEVLSHLQSIVLRADVLLVEGAGGLLSPLGHRFCLADVIDASVKDVRGIVVVAPNRLGVINHALLTTKALQVICDKHVTIALMRQRHSDISSRTNAGVLAELAAPADVLEFPFLAGDLGQTRRLKEKCKKTEKLLAVLAASGSFRVAVGSQAGGRKRRKGIDKMRSEK